MKIQKIIEIKEALDFMAKTGDVSKIALDNLTTGLEELDEQFSLYDVSKSFASGVKVQIVDCFKGHEFGIGEIVEIVEYFENDLWLAKGFDSKKWYITEEEANVC